MADSKWDIAAKFNKENKIGVYRTYKPSFNDKKIIVKTASEAFVTNTSVCVLLEKNEAEIQYCPIARLQEIEYIYERIPAKELTDNYTIGDIVFYRQINDNNDKEFKSRTIASSVFRYLGYNEYVIHLSQENHPVFLSDIYRRLMK